MLMLTYSMVRGDKFRRDAVTVLGDYRAVFMLYRTLKALEPNNGPMDPGNGVYDVEVRNLDGQMVEMKSASLAEVGCQATVMFTSTLGGL